MTNSKFSLVFVDRMIKLIIVLAIVIALFPMMMPTQTKALEPSPERQALEITPERFSYIMGICSGRILVLNMEAD
jgi:uncharacterized membrane protein